MKSIAVFCGSKSGSNPLYLQETLELGKLIANKNIKLVYGGGRVGLMGAIANSMLENGGFVIGIIPQVLVNWEQQHTGIQELQIVEDMHIRKKIMYELCDAAIILPGGYGTLDELFEMLTWNTLKIHDKKIYILNIEGYYNNLIAHIETMTEEGFLYENWKDRLIIVENAAAIFAEI
jgi:uncharacterized protein (TIGR00730 family)